MKTFKITAAIQIIYCILCLIAIISMSTYSFYYNTDFGKISFKIGEIFTFLSVFNPLGIIGSIMNCVVCFSSNLRKFKKNLLWAIITSIFVSLLWIATIVTFVSCSGGV